MEGTDVGLCFSTISQECLSKTENQHLQLYFNENSPVKLSSQDLSLVFVLFLYHREGK